MVRSNVPTKPPGSPYEVIDDPFLSLDQAAAAVGLTPRRLWNLAYRKKVPFRGTIRDPFFRLSQLDELVEAAFGDGSKTTSVAADNVPVEHPTTGATTPVDLDRIVIGDALVELRALPSDLVQAVVTSPPFWGQRVYEDEVAVNWAAGDSVAFGREVTPEEYVQHSAQVLGELTRVLKPRGTIWWNVGDTYVTRTILHGNSGDRIRRYGGVRSSWADTENKRASSGHDYLKDKDLAMIPFMVANAAQRQGLWLRSVIVWSKQHATEQAEAESRAHMPEVVADRPVTGHEYILLFAKQRAYDYHTANITDANGDATTVNVRTVWSFPPVSKSSVHGARFPEVLPSRCIQLGTQSGELVLDPFAGQGTTLVAAAALGRRYIGIEVSPTYVAEAKRRLNQLSLAEAPAKARPTRS